MNKPFRALVAAIAALAVAGVAHAQCPPDCPVKGGDDPATDCFAELASDAVRVNYPPLNPAKPKPAKEIRCFDGEAGCDLDGVANNECEFDVDLCLRNADPSLPSCTPADVTAVDVSGKVDDFPGLAGLQSAADALLPATTNTCTTAQSVVVPLKGPGSKGDYKPGKFSFSVDTTAGGVDEDTFRMVCMPRGWPGHGYDNANTRSTPLETTITPANVASLVEKWRFVPPSGGAISPRGKTVSSSVTVGAKMVYTSSWNGRVYAVDKKKGKMKWEFNTGSANSYGVQSSVALASDGRVLVGDSTGRLYCLDGKKGTLLWQAYPGSEDPGPAHVWGSPVIANNRVFVGIASHNDAPCMRGTLVAYDLDDGTELWRQYTVPERICFADTSVECSANADCGVAEEAAGSPCLIGHCDSNPDISCANNSDCPATFIQPGTCVTAGECWLDRDVSCTTDADCPACIPAKGGGVTTTPATSADGESVYMASVGCLSFPSVGNSDSLFKLDASTGAVQWVYRTEAPEQFQSFPGGPTYHDYGFLNGPILADVDDGMSGTVPVAVAGGKDGTLYAVNQASGLLEWTNVLGAAPPFAGFGLFNGAVAYEADTDRFFAALYDIDTYSGDKLVGFTGLDGSTAWTFGGLGSSWSSVTVANGMLLAGNLADTSLFVHDTTTGAQLAELAVPAGNVMGGAAVENGVVYVPYGDVFGGSGSQGGVIAYALPEAP